MYIYICIYIHIDIYIYIYTYVHILCVIVPLLLTVMKGTTQPKPNGAFDHAQVLGHADGNWLGTTQAATAACFRGSLKASYKSSVGEGLGLYEFRVWRLGVLGWKGSWFLQVSFNPGISDPL